MIHKYYIVGNNKAIYTKQSPPVRLSYRGEYYFFYLNLFMYKRFLVPIYNVEIIRVEF